MIGQQLDRYRVNQWRDQRVHLRHLNRCHAPISRLGEASFVDENQVAQEGDIVWVAVAGDQLDTFQEHLTGSADAGGHH